MTITVLGLCESSISMLEYSLDLYIEYSVLVLYSTDTGSGMMARNKLIAGSPCLEL